MITYVARSRQSSFYAVSDLEGTEKQKNWARDIRQNKLRQISSLHLNESLHDYEYRLAYLRLIPQATWWIVRRDKPAYALLKEITLQPVRIKKLPCTTSQEVLAWANYLFKTIIIDTETTGLHGDVEIVEVSAIDLHGNVLLNTLVKPQNPIPSDATKIHGITDEMVAEAPTFSEIWPTLRALMTMYRVAIYNAKYDTRVIRDLAEYEVLSYPSIFADCVMLAYANYKQGANEHGYDGYKWHKLNAVASELHIELKGVAHRSLTDCFTTLGIVNYLKQVYDWENEYHDMGEW